MKHKKDTQHLCAHLHLANHEMDRRKFLLGTAATLASLSLPSFLGGTAQAAGNGDETVFVYVFLRGAMDGLSLLPPKVNTADHGVYVAARPGAATRVESPVNLTGPNSNRFQLHPSARNIKRLYDAGSLAFVAGAGSLNPNRSHFTQQDLVESGTPMANSPSATGFLNRVVGSIPANLRSPSVPAATLGAQLTYSLRGGSSALAIPTLSSALGATGVSARMTAKERLQSLWSIVHPGSVPVEALVRQKGNQARVGLTTIEAANLVADNSLSPANLTVDQPEPAYHYAGLTAFRNAVKLLRTDRAIRVLTIDVGSWDFHQNMGTNEGAYNNLLTRLDKAIGAFARDLGGMPGQSATPNLWSKVCMVVQTEFGRRVATNINSGTDHGRGSVMMVAGGRVNGRRIVMSNAYTLTTLESGDVPVTIDYRTVVGEVLTRHLGVASLGNIFPGFTLSGLNLIRS